jgi:serine/threonine protein kinase
VTRPTPDRLGKYRVLGHVGDGPLCEVLAVRLDGIAGFTRRYAAKRLHAPLAARSDVVARFEEVLRDAAALAHGSIVQVLDLGREDDRPYAILEWVDGWDVARILARVREAGAQVPLPHALWITWHVAKAFEYAHEQTAWVDGEQVQRPFVHGSLGAEDVLVSRGGEVKVADWGLARTTDELARAGTPGLPARPGRLPPEHAAGPAPGVAADVWAVATLLVELLTLGRGPVVGGAPSLRPDLDPGLARALDEALDPDPQRRPTVTRLKLALGEALHASPGDVFTQETLAVWVRDLFGEVMSWADAQVSHELDDSVLDGDDGPFTSPGEDADRAPIASLPPAADRTQPVGPAHGDSESRAGIGGLRDDLDGRTAVGAPAPSLPPPRAPSPWEQPGALGDPPPPLALADADAEADGMAPASAGRLASLALVAAGVALGAVLALGATRTGALTLADAAVEVRGPEGATVTLDGEALTGSRDVTPGTHRVEVRTAGGAAWSVDLEIGPGEHRVLVVEAATVEAAGTETAP